MEQLTDEQSYRPGLDIAVIGMAGRFPNAGDIDTFWKRLVDGEECITFYSGQELKENGVPDEKLSLPQYVKAKGIMADIDLFDASFFGYTPLEAEHMDPQTRVFHQCVWHALEDSAYDPEDYDGSIGLYAGATNSFRWEVMALFNPGSRNLGGMAVNQLNDKDHMNTRISYKLNLNGPSFSLATQCSTSLVAVHLACQGLLGGECDMALAGGVSISIPHHVGYPYREGMILSPDGHCRPFDERARGTIFGNGAALVVLKRVEDAVEDGDNIYALVKGSAINNDGGNRAGYTAPGVDGQASVIQTALQVAQVESESIGYVEAHGTGTELGDPIEIEALNLAFDTEKKGFCRIGSVKSNTGHLDNAAGIAGLIKAVLCLRHKIIPPTIHFYNPNPRIDFENSPFRVNNSLYQWQDNGSPRRAGVSSFGIGGTNAHAILEEAPLLPQPAVEEAIPKLIILSARTQWSLDQATIKLTRHLEREPAISLESLAYTLQVGRRAFRYRRMLVGEALQEIAADLAGVLSDPLSSVESDDTKTKKRPVILLRSAVDGAAAFALNQYRQTAEALCHRIPILQEQLDTALKDPENQGKTELAFAFALEQWLIRWGMTVNGKGGPGFGELSEKDCLDINNAIFVETGPANTSSKYIKEHHPDVENCHFIQLLPANPRQLTEQLGRIWLKGGSLNWKKAYENLPPESKPRRIPLPGYCFDTHRYWISEGVLGGGTSDGAAGPMVSPLAKKEKLDDWFYVPTWERSFFTAFDAGNLKAGENWLIFGNPGNGISVQFTEYLESLENAPHLFNVPMPNGEEDSKFQFQFDFDSLVDKLKETGQIPRRIIYMWSMDTGAAKRDADIHFYDILHLARALGSRSVTSEIQLDIITTGLQAVDGKESMESGKALLLAAFKVIPREYSNITCRLIDLENGNPGTKIISRLLGELDMEPTGRPLAFRGDYRWEQSFKPVHLPQYQQPPALSNELKRGGVYLVTGGLGGIGLAVARHLASQYQARLILTGRSSLPGPDENSPGAVALRELAGQGVRVKPASVDVSDYAGMKRLMEDVAGDPDYGCIDGVFHAAGVADPLGVIQRRDMEANRSVMLPKIEGTRILMKTMAECGLEPSMLVLFSSLSSILGPFGEVGYTAANAFLDSLADAAGPGENENTSMRVLAIHWCAWQEVGMAVEAAKKSSQMQAALHDGLPTQQGVEVLERIIKSGFPRVAVSPRDLNALLEAKPESAAPAPPPSSRPVHPRPELVTPYAAPKSELQKEIAGIFKDFLGIDKVGINDNFFELGVSSMDLVQISSRLQSVVNADVPVVSMFTYSTVASLAAHLEEDKVI